MRPLLLLVPVLLAGCAHREPLRVYGQVPGFQLTAQTGAPFDRKSLDGHIWVADFIFTTCTGPCPRMSALMRQVQAKTGPEVKLVSFTVDPENDTPAVMAEYARRYQAQDGRWFFLTGEPSTLNHLARNAFKLNTVDGSMVHSTRFVLVDGRSRIRAYYGTDEEDPVDRLVRDIRQLGREKS